MSAKTPFDSEIKSACQVGGSQLGHQVRDFMEHQFGQDFTKVRIHSDKRAESLARQVHARAFTYGSDVFFGAGEFHPHSSKSRWLLAHELSHTIQQQGAAPHVQRSPQLQHPAPEVCRVYDVWRTYISLLPVKFLHNLEQPGGPKKVTPKDVDALTREELRLLGSALRSYIDDRKCAEQPEAVYYDHEKLLRVSVTPRIEAADNLESLPNNLDDWIFHVIQNFPIGNEERGILMQCAPYIHRRMKEIVSGATLTPASESELEEVGYFSKFSVDAINNMTTSMANKDLRPHFRSVYMVNAAIQLIDGIRFASAHEKFNPPGLRLGGSTEDMTGILRSILGEMRDGDVQSTHNHSMTGNAVNKDGVVHPASQLDRYIKALFERTGTLYNIDFQRGPVGNIVYVNDVESRTLGEIWSEPSNE